jgi:hypothetical protein
LRQFEKTESTLSELVDLNKDKAVLFFRVFLSVLPVVGLPTATVAEYNKRKKFKMQRCIPFGCLFLVVVEALLNGDMLSSGGHTCVP